jgi:hypothetical protein
MAINQGAAVPGKALGGAVGAKSAVAAKSAVGGSVAAGRAMTLRRAVTQPVIHASLRRPLRSSGRDRFDHGTRPPAGMSGPGLWFLLALLIFCALSADFTGEAWPLAVLLVAPFAALGYDIGSRWQARPVPRRASRIVADRRPILMHPVLVLPHGRPARLIAKLPRLLVQIPAQPTRRRGSITGKVKARLLARRLEGRDW